MNASITWPTRANVHRSLSSRWPSGTASRAYSTSARRSSSSQGSGPPSVPPQCCSPAGARSLVPLRRALGCDLEGSGDLGLGPAPSEHVRWAHPTAFEGDEVAAGTNAFGGAALVPGDSGLGRSSQESYLTLA